MCDVTQEVVSRPEAGPACCSVLHCVAVYCIVLQCDTCPVDMCEVVSRPKAGPAILSVGHRVAVGCSVLQCVAVCCSVLRSGLSCKG